MSFQSLEFLAFLAVTVLSCAALGRRWPWGGGLLLTQLCLLFYGIGGGWRGLLLLGAGTAVTAGAVWFLPRAGSGARRRTCLALASAWHIAVLLAFKYAGFLTGGAVSMGWVPLGLSFFTFQQLWLLKESYTGQYVFAPKDNLVLYAFFFPTVTSGPILRPGDFFPQTAGSAYLRPDWQDAAAGLYAICWGTVKKVLLADPLGVAVANGWAQPEALSAPAAWLVTLAYTLQLYLDFSGYCDIAAGTARLLGLRLPVNFDSPYRSASVGEFWKRWHITLTTFLRECLYFPLGGSRHGTVRTYLNILLVFLVSGFWHGAGWTFLLWGALHGLAQVLERAWPGRQRLPGAVRWAMTFLFVDLAWVFFRAPDLGAAGALLSAALGRGGTVTAAALADGVFASEVTAAATVLPGLADVLPVLALGAVLAASMAEALRRRSVTDRMDDFRPTALQGIVLAGLTVWAVLSFSGVSTFIYSNF